MDFTIAVIPGDGIGPEVIREAWKAAESASKVYGIGLRQKVFPFGAGHYTKTGGEVLPPGALNELAGYDALLLGAVGHPSVPPGPIEQELLLALRFHFDQYLNLRPAQSYPNVPLPVLLPPGRRLDIVVVRENTEDFYMGLGGLFSGQTSNAVKTKRSLYNFSGRLELETAPPVQTAYSLGLLTAPAIERITGQAFKLAASRQENKVHVATKANALPDFYGFWDQQTKAVADRDFAGIKHLKINVDNLCYQLPRSVLDFGVILCPNLFGDIVSDLVSALAGGLGLAASANIGDQLCMFEPVHGSAPDIQGTGRANPLAAILSAALMIDHLGQKPAAELIRQAVSDYLAQGQNFPFELGGTTDCSAVGDIIADLITTRGRA
ncbi:MAG: isocitrate/isopropylmalate dehydrogenase family protein [Deltaproteobacteria bacterium]|jgi:3-isopropylmalate dehydrogenase|nr:isocitrate/isopropylmalate dehydrogenase family protein [Deltaproteobacteria bacterium]